MKILLINDYGTEVGGVETYVVSLKNILTNMGHEVRIFSSNTIEHPATFSDYTFSGINPHSPFRFIPYVFNYKSLIRLRKVLREFNPDIVHLQYIFYHCSPSILLALKKYTTFYTLHAHELLAPVGIKRSVYCNHNDIGYCRRCLSLSKYCAEKIKRLVFKKLSNAINLYIAPSKYYKKIHQKNGFLNIAIIPNGIELYEYKKPNYKHKLLFVGRLEYGKGVHVLIKALHIIIDKYNDCSLNIVGTGSQLSELSKMVLDYELKGSVHFVGHVNKKLLQKYYSDCDVVIVPSVLNESFGLVGIEAMSVGRPVVGTNIGGIPDWLIDGESGFLVPPNNPTAIANSVINIFSDKIRLNNMSKKARVLSENFSINQHVNKLISLMQKYTKY